MRTDYQTARRAEELSKQIGEELEKGDRADLGKLTDMLTALTAYQGTLNKVHEMVERTKILTKLHRNLEEHKKTYGGALAWGHAGTSFGIQLGAAALGFVGSAAATSVSYLGQATDKLKGVHDEGRTAERTSIQFEGDELKRLQNDSKEEERNQASRISDALATARQTANAAHEAASRILQ